MPWAIFNRRFLHDRRPLQAIAFDIQPSPEPQLRPRDVVEAAIAAGAATEVRSPKTKQVNQSKTAA